MTVTTSPTIALPAGDTEFGGRIKDGKLDPEVIRRDFPILETETNAHPLVFLDSASTSQKPTFVIDALDAYYREFNANVHRGIYAIGERATNTNAIRCPTSGSFAAHVLMNEVHIGQGCSRCGPNM